MDAEIINLIDLAIREDQGNGDHSSLACIPKKNRGSAHIVSKEDGIIAGIELGAFLFSYIDPTATLIHFVNDGDRVKKGQMLLKVTGNEQLLLRAERLVLNFMQRMSGIATLTHRFVQEISGLNTRLLDTRKTTPGLRKIEKWAVRIGGGMNHRMGLYDMIMLKENHIAYAGGIEKAILKSNEYVHKTGLNIPIEIETRNLNEVNQVIATGQVKRIMLDNFSLNDLKAAVKLIDGRFETEASGGVSLNTVRKIAETGVDFVSVGALTHSAKNLDISMLVEGLS